MRNSNNKEIKNSVDIPLEELDFEIVSTGKPLDSLVEVKNFLTKFGGEGIDFLLVQLCSFASGKIMEAIGKSGFPLGIWGLPEPVGEGAVQLNSLCGMNMFCSIIKTFLKNEPVKYKWFFGGKDDREFISRFAITIRSLKVIKMLQSLKAGIVGGIAPGFLNVYADKRKLESRFGIEVNDYDFSEIQSIIENAGGSIRYETELDMGTTFIVEIPVYSPQQNEG